MSNPPSDRERAEFTLRVRDIYPDLVRFCARRVEHATAEDVAADALATAWSRRHQAPRDNGGWRPWVFGIARHHLLNTGRAAARRQALAVRLAQQAREDVSLTALSDLRLDLHSAWSRLTDSQQEVLALTLWDGLDNSQAAAVLGIAPVTYRVRLSRARAALRAHLRNSLPTTDFASFEGASS